ncbi:hypothetical protein CY35_13G084500 [Sphagnum magellanicum]|nr:hypothetical protein CY35_13G084500 [Sphagnum magellanicum]KAH9543809.1 hypothetical protein CY35_13G084500 [Sphagnum magellanicum]KAH9543811.1 hypothetical protein CY35_13G084500 [Sphagnum magellanicum]KAH9543813.1 hypothetical protein CY35_13G084500 [Sphagnum magellanicum]
MATAVSALVLALLLLLGAASAAVPDINAIYDALRKHGLPIGLVPQSIVDYHLSENGKFTLELADPCYAKFQEQQVFYEKTITGELASGAVKSLTGIQAKQWIFWVSITGMHVDPESPAYIYFEAGQVSKKLSVALFDAPLTCHKSTTRESTGITAFLDSTVKALLGETNHLRKALQ